MHVIDETLKNQKGNRFMTSTQKGDWGFLKFVTCLQIPFFLNNRSIVHFCGWWKWGDNLLVICCGHHKWVTSKAIISKKANVWNRNVSDIPEILILLIP